MRTLSLSLGLWLCGCAAEVEVQTQPFSQAVPVTSVGVPVYAEVAVDVPPAAVGPDITVEAITADGTLVNRARSTLALSARLSLTGTATPGTPYAFTDVNRPSYFNAALVLLPTTPVPAQANQAVHISQPALAQVLGQPRVWFILSNTVTQVGLGDTGPFEMDLNDFIVHARANKSFAGLSPGLEVSGL